MLNRVSVFIVLIYISFYSVCSLAGWQDLLKDADKILKSSTGQGIASSMNSSLSNQQISQGLKEALDIGVKKSIDILGKKNGFLKDKSVMIPMPDSLQQVEKVLRTLGQDKIADEFITSMNRAAEKAIPEVGNTFVDAISKMTLTDAQSILMGSETAATDYFRQHTSAQINKIIKPQVTEAMNKTQVTQYYKSMLSQAKRYDSFGLLDSLGSSTELDDYVTDKTMQGLFNKISVQEKMIRQNPAARSTTLLKDVFGSVGQ